MIDINKLFNQEAKLDIIKLLNDLADNWEKDLKIPGRIVGNGIRNILQRDANYLKSLAKAIDD